MKHFIYSFLILGFINSCNNSGGNSFPEKNSDTIKPKRLMNQSINEAFNQDEKKALDSVAKYKLDSIYQSCLKYLYVIYGNEVLAGNRESKETTIGECNIRLIGFKNESGIIRTLIYGVFVNDSIPTNVVINTSMGHMINGFDVNIESRKLNNARIGESGKIDILNVQSLYDSALKSKLFKDYITKYKTELHWKFNQVLSSVNVKN